MSAHIGHNVLQQTNIFYLYENSRKMLFARFTFASTFKNKHVNKIWLFAVLWANTFFKIFNH